MTDDKKRRAHNDQQKKYYDSHKFYSKKYHLKSPAQLYEEHKGVFHEKSTPEENVKGVGIDHFGILHQRNFERRANKNKY